jgi:NTP pyrophosphatase (non-canonical NTP hydrolase)
VTENFQERVAKWMLACFGPEIAGDRIERNHRFIEEALELVQANGCTESEAHQLVDYTFGRPKGEPRQEVGGVMVTLAALCLACNMDMGREAETELARVWTKVEQIRAKQAAKPKHSPLPALINARARPDTDEPEMADMADYVGAYIEEAKISAKLRDALARIARGRPDCGRTLSRHAMQDIARTVLVEIGAGWERDGTQMP